QQLGVRVDHGGVARRRHGTAAEPHVSAPDDRVPRRPGAGGEPAAGAHRRVGSGAREIVGGREREVHGSVAGPPRVPGGLDDDRGGRDQAWPRQYLRALAACDGRGSDVRDRAHRRARGPHEGRAMTTALTPAHHLTLPRTLLTPAFVILVVYGHLGWALFVFATAGVTDGLDGLIARLSGQKTSLGAWLDPMADKLLLVTTFIVLTLPDLGLANRLPIWLTVLIISRDVVIVLTVAIISLAIGPRTFQPTMFGKVATATYIVTAVVAMLFNYLGYHSLLVDAAIWASLAITLVSGFHYMWYA